MLALSVVTVDGLQDACGLCGPGEHGQPHGQEPAEERIPRHRHRCFSRLLQGAAGPGRPGKHASSSSSSSSCVCMCVCLSRLLIAAPCRWWTLRPRWLRRLTASSPCCPPAPTSSRCTPDPTGSLSTLTEPTLSFFFLSLSVGRIHVELLLPWTTITNVFVKVWLLSS